MQVVLGSAIALIAGSINGLFALPMKLTRKWSWENTWFPFSALAMVILPPLFMTHSIPHLGNAYSSVEWSTLLTAMLWGAAVYSGSLMFGRSIVYIGTGLAFALLVGGMSVFGTLAPILIYSPATLGTSGGRWIICGIALMLGGLAQCARAGRQQSDSAERVAGPRRAVIFGISLAITGGALSGLLSLGLNTAWAQRISNAAEQIGGAQQAVAANAVVILFFIGGAVPNSLYSAYLLSARHTWSGYKQSYWPNYLVVLLMALMYTGTIVLWGISTSVTLLGRLGPSIGWVLFIGAIAVSSNVGGFLTGEWRNAGPHARRTMIIGLLFMVAAVGLVGYGNLLLVR